jgi:enoyl-[acyl-carrier-protein] reductase (NADH)
MLLGHKVAVLYGAGGAAVTELVAELEQARELKRSATLADVGNVAAFVASDLAGSITDTAVNISCGATVD